MLDITTFLAAAKQAVQSNAGKTTKRYDTGHVWHSPAHYLYFDFECPVDAEHSLSKLALREYLDWVRPNIEQCTVAFAEDDDEVVFAKYGSDEWWTFTQLYKDDNYLKVSHNSSFDDIAAKVLFGLPYPERSHCTMDLAYRCWPNQRSHSLEALSAMLPGIPHKLSINLLDTASYTEQEYEEYNKRDVQGCRALHKIELSLVPPEELLLAEQATWVRGVELHINQDKASKAYEDFMQAATARIAEVLGVLGDDWKTIFGKVNKKTGEYTQGKGISYTQLREALEQELGFKTNTTSKKKLNPEKLRRIPAANQVIEAISSMGKARSFANRSASMMQRDTFDLSYRYYAAHTGRPSGKGEGRRGHNLLNIPKRDKRIAGIIRPMYELPPGMCMVSGDLSNAEYRCCAEGTLILTNNGLKPIQSISLLDKIWDGIEYVQHGGVVCQGSREVVDTHGVWLTPDHPVLSVDGWVEAATARNLDYQKLEPSLVAGLALETTSSPSSDGIKSRSYAPVEQCGLSSTPGYFKDRVENAAPVLQSADGVKHLSLRMTNSVYAGSISTKESYRGVTINPIPVTKTTVDEAYLSRQSCTHEMTFYDTSLLSTNGKIPLCLLTESTTTDGTPLEISVWRQDQNKTTTSETASRTAIVYDILNCGPRTRFWAGGLIIHNCLSLLTNCAHANRVFSKNKLADPYAEFCLAATGIFPDKRDPAQVPLRNVFKQGVLSLNYLCGLAKWIDQILLAIADGEVTLDQLKELATKQHWTEPSNSEWYNKAKQKTQCPDVVGAVCFHTYNLFHEVHPEFRAFGNWLVGCATAFAGSENPERTLELWRDREGAPNSDLVELCVDWDKRNERSLAIRCGYWSPTVFWRCLGTRLAKKFDRDEPQLTMLHKTKGFRPLTPQTAIENVTQSASRVGMSELKLRLQEKHGLNTMFDIYDDCKCLVPLHKAKLARNAMLCEAGPDSDGCGYGWAVLINPAEIEVGLNFKGKEPPAEWWEAQELDWSYIA